MKNRIAMIAFVLCIIWEPFSAEPARAQATWSAPSYTLLEADATYSGTAPTNNWSPTGSVPFASTSLSYTVSSNGTLDCYYSAAFTYSGGYPAPVEQVAQPETVTGHVVLLAQGPFYSMVNHFKRTGGTIPQSYNAVDIVAANGNPLNQANILVYWTLECYTNVDGYADATVPSYLSP
jgi:hypothetical protein